MLNNLPDITLDEDEGSRQNLINLRDYAADQEDADSQLGFEITGQTSTSVINCFIDNSYYVSCNAPQNVGYSTITVRVTDTQGATDTDSFRVTVNDSTPSNEAPVLSGIPDRTINLEDGYRHNLIDLFNYADDDQDSGNELSFEITGQSNTSDVVCFIDGDRYVECDPRDEGSSDVTVRVTDSGGLTDSDTFRITVNDSGNGGDSDAPNISGLPDRTVEENAGYSSRLIDLWAYTSDDQDSDSQLDFMIDSQSNTNLIYCQIVDDRYFECEPPRRNTTGSSTIRIEVEDSDHNTDTDTFVITVKSEDEGFCSDITVGTRTVTMSENDTERFIFDIRNRGNDDFTVTDVDVSESSSYLSVRDVDFESHIDEDSDGELEIELRSTSVPSDRDVTVNIRVKGEFDNGRTCSFSQTRTQRFRVRIDNDGGTSGGICSDIDLSATDVTIPENSSRTKTVTIRNNNSRDFTVDTVRAVESSPYFSVRVDDKPLRVRSHDSEQIRLDIDTRSVSRDQKAEVRLEVSGRFSNGDRCSTSSIREEFDVTVDNRAGPVDDDEVFGTVNISYSDNSVFLDEGESRDVLVTVTNNLDESQCFTFSSDSGRTYTTSLSKTSACLSRNDSETLTMTVRGREQGNESAQFRVDYDGKSKIKFLSVDVSGSGAAPVIEFDVLGSHELETGSNTIEIENVGGEVRDVTVTVLDAPEEVSFGSISRSIWRNSEVLELEAEVGEGFSGQFEVRLRVLSDAGVRTVPVEFSAQGEEGPDTTGLLNLATNIGLALGLIIILILVVIGVLSLISRK